MSGGPWLPMLDACCDERNRLRERVAELEAENARLRDDPEADGTDYAHPAWWRGNDAGVATLCRAIEALLDGQEPVGAVSGAEWDRVRRRVWELRGENARLRSELDLMTGRFEGARETAHRPPPSSRMKDW